MFVSDQLVRYLYILVVLRYSSAPTMDTDTKHIFPVSIQGKKWYIGA